MTVTALEPQDDCPIVTLRHADGTIGQVECRWAIGADGVHSSTRRSISKALDGSTCPGTALVADVRV